MDEQQKVILELIAQPAFFAKDGIVTWRNSAARSLLNEGTALHTILENEDTLFSQWSGDGRLNLFIHLGGCVYDATVISCGEYALFIASKHGAEVNSEAHAFFCASASLRKQLHSIVNAADSLFEQLPEQYTSSDAAAQLNQSIYRFLRLCGQMADGGQLLLGQKDAHKERIDLSTFFTSFIEQAKPLVASIGIDLQYKACPNSVFADADPALLERALYNLLVNAITYTAKGKAIALKTEKQGSLFLIHMSDEGEGVSPAVSASIFHQFDECSIGDSRRGIGLGLPIAHEIARLHGGSLIVSSRGEHSGTTVTLSISLARSVIQLRSKPIAYDYGGEFHHGLIELSEVLDANLYHPDKVQ